MSKVTVSQAVSVCVSHTGDDERRCSHIETVRKFSTDSIQYVLDKDKADAYQRHVAHASRTACVST